MDTGNDLFRTGKKMDSEDLGRWIIVKTICKQKKRIAGFRQVVLSAYVNIRTSYLSPKLWLAFGLGFVICFLLSDKVVMFSIQHDTVLQMMEPFIWTFGDAKSILIISLCLLIIFSDIPRVSNDVPFFLIRTNRFLWLAGQVL